jgi:mRNA interferase MazF
MRRGEIYLVDLDPVKGREQHGRRPVLVVSADQINGLPLVVTVVPGTTASHVQKDYPWNVRIPSTATGLRQDTVFLCFQIRALDHNRFTTAPVGNLPDEWMDQIGDALKVILDIS